ncbi:MAG: FadR family transcriptional regulator [Bradymonadaceae bacterium]|nr:FadR family transcriptional regulator [Lujinxingiaceae bacterium]
MLKPVQKKSLSDSVFEQLRAEIISGRMEPGSTLPGERVLCEMLEVNRGAVREALKRLEQARLVSVQHGGSTTVLNFRETAGTDLLSTLLVTPEGELDTQVARSVMEMRSALASDIARLCAKRGREVAGPLAEVVEQMGANRKDLVALQALSLSFWGLLVEASGNVAYQLAFNSLRDSYARFSHLLTRVLADELTDLKNYKAICEAIAAGEAEDAEFYSRDLMEIGERQIVRVLDTLDRVKE